MGLLEFLQGLSGIAVPVLVGVGAVMITPPHMEFRAARFCFWASAALTVIFVAMWGAESSLGFSARAVIVCAVASLAGLLLMGGLRWVRNNELQAAAHPSAAPSAAQAPAGNAPALPPLAPHAPTGPAEQSAAAGATLLVQCFPGQPRTVPSDGRVNLLKLVDIDGPHGGYRSGMTTQWAEPGSPVVLAETVFSVLNWDGIRCELTNYGREPLQDIRLILSVEYHEAEKLQNGFRMGALKKKVSCPVELEAIGAGQPERKTFWIANITNDFAVLKFENEATATGVESGASLKVRVSQPQTPSVPFLSPISRKQ